MRMLWILILLVGCPSKQPAKSIEKPAVSDDMCCCEHIVDGDIIQEKLLSKSECSTKEEGTCITVDPGRRTPHSCCPDAKGATCGG